MPTATSRAPGRSGEGNPERRLGLGVVSPGRQCRSAAWKMPSTIIPITTARRQPVSAKKKILVLGGGPNRIGQGIEFDYCCVHAAFALKDMGDESIMVNCNPETVSTDYDTSNKLYFEPLTVEEVLSIYHKEKPEGVIVQFGGQTPLNIADELEERRGEDPGHLAFHHRSGRRPRPVRADDGQARHPHARVWHGEHTRTGPGRGGPNRVPAHGAALVCARRPRHGGGARRGHAARVCAGGRRCDPGAAHPHRQVPGERHRGRGRRDLGRGGGIRARSHGAHRACGHALGRLGLRDPAHQHPPQAHGHHHGLYPNHRHRAGRGGAHEHAVRHLQDTVYVLEANPRASRTVPLVSKVCNIPMATDCHAGHPGQKALGTGPEARPHHALRREGGGVPLQHVPRGGPAFRPGDALHRRGARHGRVVRPGLL